MNNIPRKKLLYFLSAAAAVLILYSLFSGGEKGEVKYATEKVSRGEITSLVRASGTLEPTKEARIYAEINGTVKEILSNTNDRVAKGQLLAVIEDSEGLGERTAHFRAVLEKTSTDLRISAASHSANVKLYAKELISKEEFDMSLSEHSLAVALHEKAKADLEAAEKKLANTLVTSTLDGVVLERNLTANERIHAKKSEPMFVLAEDLAMLHLVSDVSEADVGKIKKGQEAVFRVDAHPAKSFRGKVTEVANSPKARNGVITYDVTCLVKNPALELRPGMTAEVRIEISTRKDALRIPTAALRFIPPENPQASAEAGQTVWTLRDGRLAAVEVQTGISDDSYTEITDGPLSEGDEIVIEYSFSGKNEKSPSFTLPQPRRF